MLKTLFGKSPDYVGKIKDNLEAHHFETTEVFSHGFPHHPTALAYDVLQSLVAVGNDRGTIRIFGKAGLEVCLQHEPGTPIKQLIFITNKGYLVSITGNDTINLWSLRQRPAGVMYQLHLKKEKVTKCSYTYGSHWLYVGTDKSNIHLVRVEGLVMSAYTIPWNEVAELQGGRKNRPGAVIDILEHPLDQGKVLLGFASGIMVLWNLSTKQAERRYHHTELLTSLCWMSSGKEFAASFYGGVIGVWSVKTNKGPEKLITPHDTTKGTGSPQKKSPIVGDMFSPIDKLEWLNVEGNPLFVFTGGTPYEYLTPNITLMQGKSLSMLSCDSVIVDFITVPSSPYISAAQKPKSLLVLCEEGLVVFDISEVGNPQYNVPFVLDLHKSPVTSVEYVNECPDNLTSSLYSVQSKQLVKQSTFKPWPFNGGKWGKGDMELLPSDMIVTGHSDGSIKFWHASSVSLQPSIIINTQESFKRAPIIPSKQQQHQQQKQVHKESENATVVNTSNSNTKGLAKAKPASLVTTGNSIVDKEKTETAVTTPKKKTPDGSSVSPPLSPTDVQAVSKGSKTLLVKSEERTKVSHINRGKSEKVRRHSQPTSPVKSTPTKTDPVVMVTPEKGKTPTKEATPSADYQQNKTPQTHDVKVSSSPVLSASTDNTPVKADTQPAANETTSTVAENKEVEKPQKPSVADLEEFVIIDMPPPSSGDTVDEVIPAEVPVSEYFPVAHVILNSTDWSLTIVNVGMCVMIYSFQSSRPSTAIKSLTVVLESSHPPEATLSHDPHCHDDVTDSPTFNCGWRVLPEAPATSEGAGFYLQLCVQCVLPSASNTSGAAGHVVITCVEYSSKFGILVIGLTCGLVIVDTVECKSLLVEVNEFDFIAVATGNKKGLGSKKTAASFAKSQKKAGHKSKTVRHSKGSHQKAATLAARGSAPVMATDNTDYSQSVNYSTSTARSGDAGGHASSEENKSQLCVNTVSIVELNVDKHSHSPTGSIWVGTDHGNVIMMAIHDKSLATKEHSRTIELIPCGVVHKLHHHMVSMSFLNDVGWIISTPSQQYIFESSVSLVEQSNVTSPCEEVVAASDTRVTQYAVLCSEVLCKVYTLPDNSKLTMAELVDKTKTTIVKTKTCHITGCPCMISLTFSGEILMHSLPSLRPVAKIPYKPLHDLRVLRTFHVAANGSSVVYMYSPSEVKRLSLLKHNEVDLSNVLPELYIEVADPELPGHKGVLSSLFSSAHQSVVDREELFGENAGRPLLSVAETRAGPLGEGKKTKGASNILSHAREALSERSDKLNDVVESTARMRDHADAYEEAARALREKYENRKWWQL